MCSILSDFGSKSNLLATKITFLFLSLSKILGIKVPVKSNKSTIRTIKPFFVNKSSTTASYSLFVAKIFGNSL